MLKACIDRFSFFSREVQFAGWAFVHGKPIASIDFLIDGNVIESTVEITHKLSSVIPARSIDAVMSISVFEHLAMPWKVAIELNRVMTKGAIGFVQTHQMFPLHDQPWEAFA